MTQRICSIEGCDRPHKGYGWCRPHYRQWKRYGTPTPTLSPIPLPGEDWLPVVGYESLYWVSDSGRVWSKQRVGSHGGILRTPPDAKGYPQVDLARDGKRVHRYVHHVVTDAFLGPIPPGLERRHLDGNPGNNQLGNLEFGTQSANSLDSVRHGTHPNTRKTHCKNGHPYTEQNTYRQPGLRRARRACRTCARVQDQARRR